MSPQEPTASRAPGADLAFRAGLAAAAAFLAVLAWPLFRGEVWIADDLGRFHLPMRAFYARCLASGESFDWIPNVFCGFHLQGEGQVGMYHPLHLLLYRVLPLQLAFGLELLLAYPLLIAGTFLFLSRQGLRRDAALLGALVFALSSFHLLHFVHPNAVGAIAHLPWLLLAIDAALCADDARAARIGKWSVAALTGSQLLLGHPQMLWISVLCEILWLLFLLPRWTSPRRLVGLAEAAVAGLLLGAVQLLPTLEAVGDSVRSRSESFLQAGSLHWANLLQLVEPYLFAPRVLAPDRLPYNTHELGFYAGALAPVLAAWVVARCGAGARRLAIGAAVLFAIAVLLAAGGWIPPLHRVVMSLPGIGLFRNSARYMVLAELAFAGLSAIAFADLVGLVGLAGGSAKPSRGVVVAVLLVPAASLAIVLGVRAFGGPSGSLLVWDVAPDARIWIGPILCGAAALLVLLAARGSRLALAAIPVLAVADAGAYGLSHLAQVRPSSIEALAASAPRIPGGGRAMCIPPTNVPVLDDAHLVNGYAALAPSRRFAEIADDARVAGEMQGAIAQAWMQVAGTRWLVRDGEVGRMRAPMPRARLVTRARVMESAQDLATCAITEEALVDEPLDLPPGSQGSARIVDDRPGEIGVATEAGSTQLLVLAESWHRGWSATVDDAPAPIVRAYGDFLGAVIPAGVHEVRFRFAPARLRIGRLLSIAGLLVLGTSFALGLARGRRERARAGTAGSW